MVLTHYFSILMLATMQLFGPAWGLSMNDAGPLGAFMGLAPGSYRMPCPVCGRGPKDKALGVTVQLDGAFVAHCFRCEYVEWNGGRTAATQGAVRPVTARQHETLSDYGRELWDACRGLAGTVGEAYLRARGCAIPPPDGDLRYHPALKHPPSGYTGPALVALVTDARTRAPISLHRTWITGSGAKAGVEPPRMLLGGHRKQGGLIRLWPDEAVGYGLAIGEGIESVLSVAHAYTPAWSLIDASNLAEFAVLDGIETLVIAADHDPAGLQAALKCADRWAAAGVETLVIAPEAERADWNDLQEAA